MSVRATWRAEARPLLGGAARGVALVLDEPLSFWGGIDQLTGLIIDQRHPQLGADITGRALVMPSGRGSSSSSSVLAEAVRAGHGPSLIVLRQADEIVVLGALVVEMLDGLTVPVVVLEGPGYERIATGDLVTVAENGTLEVAR